KDSKYEKVWDYVKKSRKAEIKDNKEGSFVSHVIYIMEDSVLNVMHQYFERERWCPDVFVFDGLQVRKRPLETMEQSILDSCSEYVFQKTGIRVKIVEKPMTPDPEFLQKHELLDEDIEMTE